MSKLFSLSISLAASVGVSAFRIKQGAAEASSLSEASCDHAEFNAGMCDDLCEWVNYERASDPIKICGKNCDSNDDKHDLITQEILNTGHWGDCQSLSEMFNVNKGNVAGGTHHLEIGANIGACVVELLAHTDAHITAIEMKEETANRLRCTHDKLKEEYKNRVTIIGKGLTSVEMSGCLSVTSVDCNGGGDSVTTSGSQSKHIVTSEPAVTLDSLSLSNPDAYVTVKMDIEGHEMKAMQGGTAFFDGLAENVHLKTEFHFTDQAATDFTGELTDRNFCYKSTSGDDKTYYKKKAADECVQHSN